MTVYFNGEFVDKADVSISPDDRGFLFGDGVYEVIRTEDGQLFQGDAHFQRLDQSLEGVRIDGVDTGALREALYTLLAKNDLATGHGKIYIQVTRGVAPRQHAFPDVPTKPTVYATAKPHEPPRQKWEEGVRIVLHPDQRWARCNIKSTALLPNVLANQAAQEDGAFEAVLTRDGFVTEGSHSSAAAIFDGTVVTHPLTNRILPSITRDVVLDLCQQANIPVDRSPIPVADLPSADEIILMGTTTGVMPVVQVDDWTVGDGTPGSTTRALQDAFQALSPST